MDLFYADLPKNVFEFKMQYKIYETKFISKKKYPNYLKCNSLLSVGWSMYDSLISEGWSIY